jgi:hypothetical protein
MTRFALALGALALVACGGDKDDDASGGTGASTTTGGGGGGGGGCANSIINELPENGASGAYYRTNVYFTLATAEADASLSLADSAGGDVAGTSAVDGTLVTFTPTAPLAPGETYNSTLDWSCGPTESSWSVDSSVGTAVDPGALIERAYSLDLSSGNFVQPSGVGELLGSLLEFSLFVGVTAADDTSVAMVGALSDDSGTAQDLCSTTIDFPVAADFTENPFFSIQSDSLPLEVEGFSVVIDDLELSGAFAADATSVEGVTLAGKIDTRLLVELVQPGGADDAVCVLVSTFNVDCEPCSDGTGDFCLTVYVDNMVALEQGGFTIQPRTAEDVAADPACD